MSDLTVQVHAIATDGLPDREELVGRVAFIFDGNIISGYPLSDPDSLRLLGETGGWEPDSDISPMRGFAGVTHWIEFPQPIWEVTTRRAANSGNE